MLASCKKKKDKSVRQWHMLLVGVYSLEDCMKIEERVSYRSLKGKKILVLSCVDGVSSL